MQGTQPVDLAQNCEVLKSLARHSLSKFLEHWNTHLTFKIYYIIILTYSSSLYLIKSSTYTAPLLINVSTFLNTVVPLYNLENWNKLEQLEHFGTDPARTNRLTL